MIYAGLDLHQKFSVVTVRDAQGKEIIKQQKLPNNGKLSDFFQTFEEPVTVAMKTFPSAKKLCSYAGVIPSTYASGNNVFHGHITKQGSKWLRWIMAEVVTHCIDRPGHLQRFYSKLERRKGKKIARVAAERKLLEWIYHILRNGKSYEEMGEIASAWGKPATRSGR